MNAPSSPPHAEMLPEGTGGALPASPPSSTPACTPRPVSAPGRRQPFPLVAGWLRRAAGAGRPARASAGARPLAVARPRRMRQVGRAALLWALAFYAAAQLAVLPFEDRWPQSPSNIWRRKWQQLRELTAREPDRPLLVMLGSSRTERAFQAGRLNDLPGPDGKPFLAYNFGVAVGGPLHQRLFLQEMFDAGIRPRLLLVEFLPPLLNESRRGYASEEHWTSGYWLSLPQILRLWPYLSRPDLKVRNWLEARLAPWYAYRPCLEPSLLSRLFPGMDVPVDTPYDPWGCQVPEAFSDAECLRLLGVAWYTFYPTLRRLRMGKGPSRALRDLLDLCRREEIPVVLVLMPESTVFRSWYAPEGLAAARGLLAQLRETYGVRVIDASDWLADKDFVDGHHAQGSGAAVFTTRLRAELGRILPRPGETSGQHAAR